MPLSPKVEKLLSDIERLSDTSDRNPVEGVFSTALLERTARIFFCVRALRDQLERPATEGGGAKELDAPATVRNLVEIAERFGTMECNVAAVLGKLSTRVLELEGKVGNLESISHQEHMRVDGLSCAVAELEKDRKALAFAGRSPAEEVIGRRIVIEPVLVMCDGCGRGAPDWELLTVGERRYHERCMPAPRVPIEDPPVDPPFGSDPGANGAA